MLSILIVNWNTRDLLARCLTSISSYPPREPYEVIVVDNASSDRSAEMVKERFPHVTLIKPGKNTGYAMGNNLAFAAAKGEWLLTLNPDTEVYEGTLQGAVDKLSSARPEPLPPAPLSSQGAGEGEPRLRFGALGVKQVGPQGETQRSVRGFPTILGILGDLTGLGRIFKNSKLDSYRRTGFDYEQEQIAPQPMGTFLLFRRQALEAVGDPKKPFDEGFPIFFNEVDLLYRLNKAGWPCLYTPEVSIHHLGGESTKLVKKSMIWESHNSLARFFQKHYRTPFTAPFLPLLRGLLALAALVRARGYHAGFKS